MKAPQPGNDLIMVKGISFEANHGAYAAERRQKRRFEVDLELRTRLARPAASDRLADTVDYRALCQLVVEVGTTRTFKLIEKLAGEILIALAARYPSAELTVEVRKLQPPCPGSPSVSAVRMTRAPL